jgi:hypothetical protein
MHLVVNTTMEDLKYNKAKGTIFFKRDYVLSSDWWTIGLTPKRGIIIFYYLYECFHVKHNFIDHKEHTF